MMKRKRDDKSFDDLGDGVSWCRASLIGKGSYGSIYLANLKKSRSQYHYLPSVFAVKSAEVSDSGSIQKEKEALNNIQRSPSIVECFGEEITTGESAKMVFNLLLEYASGGTLAQLIKKSGGNGLPESEVRSYTRSVLQGIKCIHKSGYVHCDIKPQNILLVPITNSGGGITKFKAKFGDLVKQCKMKLDRSLRGTLMYLSPETVNDHVQEPPSDIWSLDCVVLEMLTGKHPIGGGHRLPKIPSEITKEGKDFRKSCFARKAVDRWTADMLLNHPFVVGIVDDEGEEVFDVDIDVSLPLLVTDDGVTCSSSGDWSFESEDELSYYSFSEEGALDTNNEAVSNYGEEYVVQVEGAGDVKRSRIAPQLGGINETSNRVLSNIVQQCPALSSIPIVLQHYLSRYIGPGPCRCSLQVF